MTTSKLARTFCASLIAVLVLGATSALAQSGISVSTVNGQTTVTWKGQQVFSGPTTGPVRSGSITVNGEEFAAAFAGDRVVWENVPGAAERVKAAKGPEGAGDTKKRSGKRRGQSSEAGISVSTVNGQTDVRWKGRQVYVGPTKGHVSGKSKSVNGKEFAAVFDGDTVLWENAPGAAQMVK